MAPRESIVIDCATCPVQGTHACTDCLVTYMCNRAPGHAVVVDLGELRALRLLSDGGLVPHLRHPAASAR